MVKFEKMSQTKAEMDSATGKRAEIMVEYLGYLNQLQEGEAGMLTVSGADESPTALRRRISKAAQAAGKEIVIRRKGTRSTSGSAPGLGDEDARERMPLPAPRLPALLS